MTPITPITPTKPRIPPRIFRAMQAHKRLHPVRPIPPARQGSAWQHLFNRAAAWLRDHMRGIAPVPPAGAAIPRPCGAALLSATQGAPAVTPEALDALAAEHAQAGRHPTAAALRAASTSWRRTEADLAEAQRDNSLLQQRINRARSQLADPGPEYRPIARVTATARDSHD